MRFGEVVFLPRSGHGPTSKEVPLEHYRSLMPLAITARKPMFLLRPADGGHADAVRACYDDFLVLARRMGERPASRCRDREPVQATTGYSGGRPQGSEERA